MISNILKSNDEVVRASKWPVTPKKFFDKLCKIEIAHQKNPRLYHVICDLFNSWCLWCEGPSTYKDGTFYSSNPYDPYLKI